MSRGGFDLVAESVGLVESASVAGAVPMTRRHRWQPVAVHVNDGLAVTLFARRSRRRSWYEGAVLAQSPTGTWDEHDRFWQQGPVAPREAHDSRVPPDQCVRAHTMRFSESRRGGISWVALQVTDVVATVELGGVAGAVGPNGWVVAVWPGRRIPRVAFEDAHGSALTTLRANHARQVRRVHRHYRRPPWRWLRPRPRQTFTYRSGWGWKLGRRR